MIITSQCGLSLGLCPGLARIGLSFPSSGGEALAGLFTTLLMSGPGADSGEHRRIGERVCYAIFSAHTAVSVVILLCSLLLLLLLLLLFVLLLLHCCIKPFLISALGLCITCPLWGRGSGRVVSDPSRC